MTAPIDTDKLIRWYDFQAPLYAWWRNRYDTVLVRYVTELIRRDPPRELLDAGCGTGLFTIALARALPDRQLHGVDLSAGMLSVAARAGRERGLRNVHWLRADVRALPYPAESFDTVVAAGLLPNVNRRAAVLRELGRVLRPRGQLVLIEFDRSEMGAATRAFFKLMILGYRAVSAVFRRFRFADGWSIERSTIDRDQLACWAAEVGFRIASAEPRGSHVVYRLDRGSRA
ncbi:MAG TPA: methyltransferase domain-containing protein [Candidatus Polarisedimenticolaceae bacterium]|nr:methyltransferase domain-containing protein [Candidatus Polarisedimenticolaceae bacterium]